MKSALFAVVVIGIGVGSMVPLRQVAPPAAAAAPVAADTPVETVLQRNERGHFTTFASVNDQPIHFVVDTGADIVALSQDDAARAHIKVDPAQFEPIGHGASGEVRGQRVHIASIVLDGKRVDDLNAVVLADSEESLLGQNYLRHVSVSISGDEMRLR